MKSASSPSHISARPSGTPRAPKGLRLETMWGTYTCYATTSPVAATAARASSASSWRAEKRFTTVGGSAHAAGRRVALKAAAEGAATGETEDVIPRVDGEFVWDEDRPFHRCVLRREGGPSGPPRPPPRLPPPRKRPVARLKTRHFWERRPSLTLRKKKPSLTASFRKRAGPSQTP